MKVAGHHVTVNENRIYDTMSNLRNLFIVTDEGVFLGRDTFHKDLAKRLGVDPRFVLGGGVFDQRTHKDKWILFGTSHDFGKFEEDFVQMFVDEKKVFWFNWPFRKMVGEFEFTYDMEREEKDSDRFQITRRVVRGEPKRGNRHQRATVMKES